MHLPVVKHVNVLVNHFHNFVTSMSTSKYINPVKRSNIFFMKYDCKNVLCIDSQKKRLNYENLKKNYKHISLRTYLEFSVKKNPEICLILLFKRF